MVMKIGGSKETIVQIDLHSISPSPLGRRSAVPRQAAQQICPSVFHVWSEFTAACWSSNSRPTSRSAAADPNGCISNPSPCHPRRGSHDADVAVNRSTHTQGADERADRHCPTSRLHAVAAVERTGSGAKAPFVRSLVAARCTLSSQLQPATRWQPLGWPAHLHGQANRIEGYQLLLLLLGDLHSLTVDSSCLAVSQPHLHLPLASRRPRVQSRLSPHQKSG